MWDDCQGVPFLEGGDRGLFGSGFGSGGGYGLGQGKDLGAKGSENAMDLCESEKSVDGRDWGAWLGLIRCIFLDHALEVGFKAINTDERKGLGRGEI